MVLLYSILFAFSFPNVFSTRKQARRALLSPTPATMGDSSVREGASVIGGRTGGPPHAQNPDPSFMVLNLERRADRWRCVHKEFLKAGINPTRVISVDATDRFAPERRRGAIMGLEELSDAQKRALVTDTGINTGHLATFLSHISALRRIRDQNLAIGCIFEDDVSLVDNFRAEFDKLVHELPSDWEILVLSMYCHSSWKSCADNRKLSAVSPHLRPVVAFMSGAGYCLNAQSAAKVLSTIPCKGNRCGVAIDGYLSSLAHTRQIKAYRAIKLPVIIPQDLMHSGKPVRVSDPDCYSRYDSDIALWWKPETKRTGVACIFEACTQKTRDVRQCKLESGSGLSFKIGRGELFHLLRSPSRNGQWWNFGGKPHSDSTVAEGRIKVEEDQTVNIFSTDSSLFMEWHVVNTQNTVFLFDSCCAIVVSKDLWRGIATTVKSSAKMPYHALDVGWYEHSDQGIKMRGGTATRHQEGELTMYKALRPGEHFEFFLPDTSRTIVIAIAGTGFDNPLVVQPLNSECDSSLGIQNA